MTSIKCSKKDCKEMFATDQAVSPNATFSCVLHTEQLHLRRQEKPVFQEYSHDPRLNGETEESEEYDNDWGMSGKALLPSDKCEHGNYNPHKDARYCSVCTPIIIRASDVARIKKHKGLGIKIGVLKRVVNYANKITPEWETKLGKQDEDPWRD